MPVEKLRPRLQEEDLSRLWKKYHFDGGLTRPGESPARRLGDVYVRLDRALDATACYCLSPDKRALKAAVTLGKEFDAVLERWSCGGELLKAYAGECVGMELLLKSYRLLGELLREREGLWICGYHFPGDGSPLTGIRDILTELEATEISCSEAYMLTPKKSAVFTADLTPRPEEERSDVCAACLKLSCVNHPGQSQKI